MQQIFDNGNFTVIPPRLLGKQCLIFFLAKGLILFVVLYN